MPFLLSQFIAKLKKAFSRNQADETPAFQPREISIEEFLAMLAPRKPTIITMQSRSNRAWPIKVGWLI